MFRTIDFNIKTLYNFQHIGGINCMRSIKLCLKWGGEQIGKEDFWNSLPKEKTSEFINGMAEFLKFTHSQSVGNV